MPPPEGQKKQFARLPARPRWCFEWDAEKMELVQTIAEDGEHETGIGKSNSNKSASAPTFDELFPLSEIEAAVCTAKTSSDPAELHEASSLLRDATSEARAEDCREMLRVDAIFAFMQLLASDDISLQEDAVLSLLNIMQHQSLHSLMVDKDILLPLLAALKTCASPSVKSNIAALLKLLIQRESQSMCILVQGALDSLLELLEVRHRGSESTKAAFPRASSSLGSGSNKFMFSPTVSSSGDNCIQNACVALMHLAHFKPVRKALLARNIVSKLVDVLRVREFVDSEQAICALFLLLAKNKGGPEAICQESEGAAVDALMQMALMEGEEVCQEMALDVLLALAGSNSECAKVLAGKSVPQQLAGSSVFAACTHEVRMKVVKVCTTCAANSTT